MVRQARPVRDRIVPEVVERMSRRFIYPEPDFDPIAPVVLGGGGAGGTPTIVIAAANATDTSKSKADFICEGSNDHLTIQAGIDLLPFGGGRILFTEGEYHPDWDQIKIPNSGFVTIEGIGRNTIFDMNDTNPTTGTGPVFEVVAGSGVCEFKNFTIWFPSNGDPGGIGIELNASYCSITNVAFDACRGTCVNIGTSIQSTSITDCRFIDSGLVGIETANNTFNLLIDGCSFDGDGEQISLDGTDDVRITNCNITSSGDHCIAMGSNAVDNIIIANNVIETAGTGASSIFTDQGCTRLTVSGNTIRASDGFGINLANDSVITDIVITANIFSECDEGAVQGLGGANINITGNTILLSSFSGLGASLDFSDPNGAAQGFGLNIADNIIDGANTDAISVDQYGDVRIAGNILRNIDGHGIALNDVSDAKVSGNVISNVSGDGTNTFDGIILTGDSDRNYVHGNQVIVGAVVVPRYGINISASTCDCNIVVGNALGDPAGYGTDALNDAGTDTQLFYPSDGTYGDNFTSCPPASS